VFDDPDYGLLKVLATVPDPRGLRYPMALLRAIAILATAAGMRGFAATPPGPPKHPPTCSTASA
jgi:hypothetical protein